MFPPSLHPRSSASRSSGPVVLLRLVLLLAAWQGPIPWCHNHAAGTLAESTTWLAEHLKSHHGPADQQRQDGRSDGQLGWHFHADFPARPVGDDESRSGQSPAEFPASSVGGLRLADVHSDDRQLAPSHLFTPVDRGSASASATAPPHLPGNFFDGYAATLPLPLRFCILRC